MKIIMLFLTLLMLISCNKDDISTFPIEYIRLNDVSKGLLNFFVVDESGFQEVEEIIKFPDFHVDVCSILDFEYLDFPITKVILLNEFKAEVSFEESQNSIKIDTILPYESIPVSFNKNRLRIFLDEINSIFIELISIQTPESLRLDYASYLHSFQENGQTDYSALFTELIPIDQSFDQYLQKIKLENELIIGDTIAIQRSNISLIGK